MNSVTLALLAAAILRGVAGHTFFVQLNDQKQGIPQPPNNNPLLDVKSQDIACNSVQRGSDKTLIPLQAGSKATLTWRHTPQSGPDDVIDASHHGPVTAWMKKVNDATSDPGAGDGWFKIAEDGFENGGWGVDRLIQNKGVQTVTIPSCLPAGQYLLRGEIIALHEAQTVGKAQFYAECAQVQLGGSNNGGGGNSTAIGSGVVVTNSPSATGSAGSSGSMGSLGDHASGSAPGVPMSSGSAASGLMSGGEMNGGFKQGSIPGNKNGTSNLPQPDNGSSGGSTTSSSTCNGSGSQSNHEQNGGSSSSTSATCGDNGSPPSTSGSSMSPQGPMNNDLGNNGVPPSGGDAKAAPHFFGGMFPRANMPQTVSLPGAYDANDPGIKVDIYNGVQSYKAPGPPVFQC